MSRSSIISSVRIPSARLSSALALLMALALSACAEEGGGLAEALAHRGKVAVHGELKLPERLEGTERVGLEAVSGAASALASGDATALARALEGAGARGLVSARASGGGEPEGLLSALSAGEAAPPLRAVYLDAQATYYEPEPLLELSELHRLALARVARQILGGEKRPPIAYFPEPLRQVRSVEVMVLLRDRSGPRLWRSSRAGSIASALSMAAEAARERWTERADALGGALVKRLPEMDVEVSILVEDGTFLDRRPAFMASALGDEHGVGFEQSGRWRYLLPDRLQALGEGARERAFSQLLADNDLPPGALSRSDLRFYRLRVHPLAVSPGNKL